MAAKKLLLLVGLVAGAVVSFATPFTRVDAAVFKIATVSPDGATWMVKMRAGAAEIERLTEGRIRFKFYPGGIMGSDQSVLRKIRVGQLHGGAVTTGSLIDIYPDFQIYGVPLIFDSLDEVDYVRKRMDDHLVKGLEERGLISFGLAEGGFAYIMCNKPLRSIADLKQQRVWVPSGDDISQTVFEIAGVSPIQLPISDVMTGLQTGLIDTIGVSPIAAIALQWYTRVKYVTDTPLSYIAATLVLDRKAFTKLSPADQVIVREVMGRVFREIDARNRQDHADAKEALRKQGVVFVTPSPQELAQWKKIAIKARETLMARGVYSAEVVGVLRDHLKTYRKLHATGSSNNKVHATTVLR